MYVLRAQRRNKSTNLAGVTLSCSPLKVFIQTGPPRMKIRKCSHLTLYNMITHCPTSYSATKGVSPSACCSQSLPPGLCLPYSPNEDPISDTPAGRETPDPAATLWPSLPTAKWSKRRWPVWRRSFSRAPFQSTRFGLPSCRHLADCLFPPSSSCS